MRNLLLFACLLAFSATAMAQPKLGGPYPKYLIAKKDSSNQRSSYYITDSSKVDTSAFVDFKPGSVAYSSMVILFTDDSVNTRVYTQVGFDGQGWTTIDSVDITSASAYSLRKHRSDTLACNMVRWITDPIDAPFKADDSLKINFRGRVAIQEP